MREEIRVESGAPPQGIYSQAILAEGRFLFVSGQISCDPESGKLVIGSFREQAELTFRNIGTLLDAASTSWENVVRVGIYLTDMDNFAEMNEVYLQFVSAPYPARTTVEVGLPKIAIEVDCIAIVPQ